MRVVVTGATGHLGGTLVRRLLAAGVEVRALGAEPLHQRVPALDGTSVERRQVDLLDRDGVRQALAGAEVVFHLAARVSIASKDPLCDAVNVDGVANVLDGARRAGVRRLVHVSSVAALHTPAPGEDPADAELRVDAPLPYDRSKARGEALVRAAAADGLDTVVLHPTGIVGPGDAGTGPLNRMLLDAWRGRLPAIVRGGFDYVDVRDVAAALHAAADHGPAGGRYLIGGHAASLHELVTLAATIGGVRGPRAVLPAWIARGVAAVAEPTQRRLGRPLRFSAGSLDALTRGAPPTSTRAAEVLGHAPRLLADTLADTHASYVAAGLLRPRRAASRRRGVDEPAVAG